MMHHSCIRDWGVLFTEFKKKMDYNQYVYIRKLEEE